MPVFELEKVSFTYPDGVPAPRDVGSRVDAGERPVVLKARASGKAELLAGVATPPITSARSRL